MSKEKALYWNIRARIYQALNDVCTDNIAEEKMKEEMIEFAEIEFENIKEDLENGGTLRRP